MVSVSDEYEITILHFIFILLHQRIRVIMQTGIKSKRNSRSVKTQLFTLLSTQLTVFTITTTVYIVSLNIPLAG
jgi:hypothetical protein